MPLDPTLAEALLAAPLQALKGGSPGSSSSGSGGGGEMPAPPVLPQLDEAQYKRDYAVLLERELPYFKKANACGHCGTAGDSGGALSDRAYFDFVSYVQYKALARQVGATLAVAGASTALSGWERMHAGSPEMQLRAAEQAWQDSLPGQAALFDPGSGGFAAGAGSREEQLRAAAAAYRACTNAAARESGAIVPKLTAADSLRLAVGGIVLAHAEADLADSVRSGDGGDAARAALDAVRSTSPELDSVRAGAQALLAWFTSKGFAASAAFQQFGLSLDEYENHYVWSLGEPAFLKYWLESPASLRGSTALDQEEGFSQDYVASALQAYFRRCGVVATSLKRYPSYSQPELVAEQWTLRRLAPLPEGYDWQQYRDWKPDSCPGFDEDTPACY